MSKITELQALRDSVEYLTDLITLIRQGKASDSYIDLSLNDIVQLNKESDKSIGIKKDKTQKLWELFLKRGRAGLTCHDAVMYARYHRLAAYVHTQIAAGVPIQSQWETDSDGNRYKRYWLQPAANDSDFRQRKSADTDQSSSANSGKPKKRY